MHRMRLSVERRSQLLLDAIGFNLDIQIHMRDCPDCAEIDDPCPEAQAMITIVKRKRARLESLGLLENYNG